MMSGARLLIRENIRLILYILYRKPKQAYTIICKLYIVY